MDMHARLTAIADLVAIENKLLQDIGPAGFFPHEPHALAKTVPEVVRLMAPDSRSLDMGAGTGTWWLMMAAAGIPSYAIEFHPQMVAICERLRATCIERGLIDESIPCVIACDDMIPPEWRARYRAFRQAHGEMETSMPGAGNEEDVYKEFGIALDEFEIVYCWAWPTQSRFIFNMLNVATGEDSLLVLPSYVRYTQGEHMNASMKDVNTLVLDILARVGDTVIGKRIADDAKSI